VYKLGVSEGVRLNQIDLKKVEKVDYSNKDNLIFKYAGETDWKYVFDENGNKIPKQQIHVFRKAIANPAAIDWLISRIGKK